MRDLLEKRFAAPAWVLLHEVRNGTGYARRTTRTADAIAMSLWPSRGLELHGIEIKSSRNDWLRELAEPAKAEEIQRFCDRWWLAVTDADIVQPGELPPTWGLLVPHCGALKAKVEAPKLTATPVDRLFLAALLRNVFDGYVHKSAIDGRVKAAADAAKANADRWAENKLASVESELATLRAAVAAFEEKAGIHIRGWNSASIGAAVRQVMSGYDARAVARDMRAIAQRASLAADDLEREVTASASPPRRTPPAV